MADNILRYEAELREVEQKTKEIEEKEPEYEEEYESEEDTSKFLKVNIELDDIDLEEEEIRAYMNLKKAKELIKRKNMSKEELQAMTSFEKALEPSNKPILHSKDIEEKLAKIKINPDWVHTLAMTAPTKIQIEDPEDDLQRELAFYKQALVSAEDACTKLQQLGIPAIRPDDYFAEMIKRDVHMKRVKAHLLGQKKRIEEAQERRRIRDQQKFGKKTQLNALREKLEKKKQTLEAIKYWKNTQKGKNFDLNELEKNVKEMNKMKSKNASDFAIKKQKQEIEKKKKEAAIPTKGIKKKKKRPGKLRRQKLRGL